MAFLAVEIFNLGSEIGDGVARNRVSSHVVDVLTIIQSAMKDKNTEVSRKIVDDMYDNLPAALLQENKTVRYLNKYNDYLPDSN